MSIFESILSWLGFHESPGQTPPSPRKDHHIGSAMQPYRTGDSDMVRRNAIQAGVNEEKDTLVKQGLDETAALQKAVDAKRKRLILIRTLQRNKRLCKIFDGDVWWMYKHYELETSGLKFKCK